MVTALNVRPPQQVLEAGFGRGGRVQLFPEALPRGGSLAALDIERWALENPNARAKRFAKTRPPHLPQPRRDAIECPARAVSSVG